MCLKNIHTLICKEEMRSKLTFVISIIFTVLSCQNANCSSTDRGLNVMIKNPYDSVLLHCIMTGSQKVIWRHNNILIAAGKRILRHQNRYSIVQEEQYSCHLQISRLRNADRGTFTCIDLEKNVERKYEIKLREKARIGLVNETIVCNEHAVVNLLCNAYGYPKPEIKWYIIDEHGKLEYIGIKGPLLQIRNVSRHCATTYRCEAYNGVMNSLPDWRNITLKVQFKPLLDIYETNENTDDDEDFYEKITNSYHIYRTDFDKVIVKCQVSSYPRSNITWLRNLEPLVTMSHGGDLLQGSVPDVDDYELVGGLINNRTQYLQLAFMVMKNTLANYTCRGQNTIGGDECSIVVHEGVK